MTLPLLRRSDRGEPFRSLAGQRAPAEDTGERASRMGLTLITAILAAIPVSYPKPMAVIFPCLIAIRVAPSTIVPARSVLFTCDQGRAKQGESQDQEKSLH